MRRFLRHLRAAFRRSSLDDRVREELVQHRAWKAQSYIDAGVPAIEAQRRAAVDVGNITKLREDARAVWGFPALDGVLQDLRYGFRQIARAPLFSAIAILSLAIGIGATTAVFSLADAVLLRTMPVRDPSSLFIVKWTSGLVPAYSALNGSGGETATGLTSTSFSYSAYRTFQSDASRVMDVLGFADLYNVNLAIGDSAELGTAHAVSGNYFSVLGVNTIAGRPLSSIDDNAGAAAAAVISSDLWHRRFGGGAMVGTSMLINSVPFTVVGILPSSFHGTGQVGSDPDVYVPLALKSRVVPNDDPPLNPNFWWVLAMGRLKPGVHTAEARDALDVLLKRTVAAARPQLAVKDLPSIALLPGGQGQVEFRDEMRDPLRAMALVTSIVLLVACANVAGLLLARGRARGRELSVRVALGARRGRVVRQLLTEAMLIAGGGAAVGVAAAQWLSAALAPALGGNPRVVHIMTDLDSRVLLFAVAVACASALLFGLVPALRATRVSVNTGLQDAGRTSALGRRHARLTGALIVVQIALALLLVAGATLLVRSLRNLQHEDLGFDASNLLLFHIDPSLTGYAGERATHLEAELLDRLRAVPGVQSASISNHVLLSYSVSITSARRADETQPPPGPAWRPFQDSHQAWTLTIDERFFDTFGMHVLRGRHFSSADASSLPTAIVNCVLARQLFGTDDVVGRQFYRGTPRGGGSLPPVTIVGVVDDAKYASVRGRKPPTMYLYYRQPPGMKGAPTFAVRTAGPPTALASAVREIVHALDPQLPVYGMITQQDQIAESLQQERLFARLATLLGTIAVLLSAIGLYGLLAYGVTRRVPEIGLRMALGAERHSVQWMILRESLVLAGLGLAAGVPLAIVGTRVLASMLFGLEPRDPATMAVAAISMLVLAALAGYIPARRAARVDPMVALRAE